jgi:hypothetical protein
MGFINGQLKTLGQDIGLAVWLQNGTGIPSIALQFLLEMKSRVLNIPWAVQGSSKVEY